MEIEILLYDGFDDLDVFGPVEVLHAGGLAARLVTLEPAAVVTSAAGVRVEPHSLLGDPPLLIVPGGGWSTRAPRGAWAEAQRGEIPRMLAERHRAGRRLAAVCTGGMLLAAAGLLRGRTAITHHSAIADLAAYGADVVSGARVVDAGDVVTSGGVTSGIDLALAIVARERGQNIAAAVASEIEYPWAPS